jgi:dipeptidyl aminopeptidase/acylaminoacyl peptidase
MLKSELTRSVSLLALTLAGIAAGGHLTRPAAQASQAFTLDQILTYPFPEHLTASPTGSAIAWTLNERGRRNIYVAEGPEFKPRRLTNYGADDGKQVTSLSFCDDRRYIVFVRDGNEKGASLTGDVSADPSDRPAPSNKQLWSISTRGRELKLIADGDMPVIAPRSHRVAFVRDGTIWIASIDGSKPAESVFVRGTSEALAWSPDGRTLAFASNREDHSFIGLFTGMNRAIRYIAPSTSRDSTPVWSPDGKRIAFIRRPGRVDTSSMSVAWQPDPWAIWVADVASGAARAVWKSGPTVIDSLPAQDGGANLRWGAGNRLVFLSYADGWPHLYSVRASGGPPMLLTPGPFMVEQASMAPDRRSIVYSANRGPDPKDVDRRHIFRVPVSAAESRRLTSGLGIESSPVVTGDQGTVAYMASNASRAPLPAIQPLDGRPARTLAGDRVPAEFPASKLITPESIVIRAPNGVDLHAQLFKAKSGDAVRPALIYAHGGPQQQMLLGWHHTYDHAIAYAMNQYLASRGFLVLSVNYRLGAGYGHAFQYPDIGSGSVPDYDDVVAAAKYLQTRADVDPMRLGIWGASYGGYVTALALARSSDAFAAGADVNGPPELVLREFRRLYAAVTDEAGDILPSDPIWTSSILIVHGGVEGRVRFNQTVELGQLLAAQQVPVEMRALPDEPQQFARFRSWIAAARTTAEYFERRFLNRTDK